LVAATDNTRHNTPASTEMPLSTIATIVEVEEEVKEKVEVELEVWRRRRRRRNRKGGIKWALENPSTNSYVVFTSTYLSPLS
jgi:hypothetical protein